MRFEHDIDDIDVYSLCESVYYSCNNDEYDYVLECVNDWIYNGYNDNILLEDIILNEAISYDRLKNLIKKKFHQLFPGEDFSDYDKGKYLNLPDDHPIQRFFLYTTGLLNRDFAQNRKNLLKFHPEAKKFIFLPSGGTYWGFIKDLTPEKRQQEIDALDITPDEYYKRTRKDYRILVGKETPPTSSQQEPTLTSGTAATPQPQRKVETKTQQQESPKQETPAQTPPNTPPSQPSSPTPLEDNKGKPAGTPPAQPPKQNTPSIHPPKEEPPKSNTPVVPTDTPSRLSRATTWMKNNKVKGGLGVVAAGAAIGGSIYAYKRFKNKPRSVIAKRIAAKILSVIDKLLGYLQNKADGR